MIAAEDDPEVFAALFAAAEAWLKARGRAVAMGPFNLSINEETGLLVDGFDTPPMLMMGHDPPYAGPRIEALGYAKAKDVFAYIAGVPDFSPAVRRPGSTGRRQRRGAAARRHEPLRRGGRHPGRDLQRRLGRQLGLHAR